MINTKPRTTTPKVNLVRSKTFLIDIQQEEDQDEEIKKTHESNDHRGIVENYDQIRRKYFFPNMKELIRRFVNNCVTCQQVKYDRNPPQLQYSLTETPKRPMEIIHLDLFQLQSQSFLTIIDKFSKFAAAYYLTSKTDKIILSKLIHFASLHGIPGKMIFDNEICFVNRLIKNFAEKHQIKIHTTTPYNSTGNSPVERLHSTLKELCSIISSKQPTFSLEDIMNQAILSYNNAIHSTTKLTPFELLKGHYAKIKTDFTSEIDYLAQHTETFEQLCNEIYENTLTKKTKLINKLNSKRKPVVAIRPNQFVFVKKKRRSKLKPPYRKLKVLNDKGLIINTPEGKVHKTKIKRLFQVSSNDPTRTPTDIPPE